tara:strand:- start:4691 stop:5572 length:882 start_codon:yes stop_codon:yes gene_type:complete
MATGYSDGSNVGKWKNYVLKPIELSPQVILAGGWDASAVPPDTFQVRVTNDSKVGVKYFIDTANALGQDTYKWTKYEADGVSTNTYWASGTTEFKVPTWTDTSSGGSLGALIDEWISLDDGVEIKWNDLTAWTGAEIILFTTPDEQTYRQNRIYIDGYATTLDFPTGSGNFGSYTDSIALHGSNYQVVWNYNGTYVGETTGSGILGNVRGTLGLYGSTDNSNFQKIYDPMYDVQLATTANDIYTSIFDKEEVTAYSSAGLNNYKLRTEYVNGSFDERTLPQYVYYNVALIKNY